MVVSALLKLVGGGSQDLNPEAFLAQARDYDEALKKSSRVVRTSVSISGAPRTHPLPTSRAAELDRWARSPEYAGILARGRVLSE